MNNEQIEFQKTLSMNRKNASIKSCIWGGNDCSGRIINAHSIQRGKILSAIADNGKIYYLGVTPSENMSEMKVVFKAEGIKKFSTFTGFCGWHDKNIFQHIEDVTFSGTDEQKHIYAYRAVTKELHANLESVKFSAALLGDKLHDEVIPSHMAMTLPSIIDGSVVLPDFMKNHIIEGMKNDLIRQKHKYSEMNAIELESISNFIKHCLLNKNYTGLTHKYYYFDEEFPIACSSSFIPYFDFEGTSIISKEKKHSLSIKPSKNPTESSNVFLNIFPENGRTHVLFSYFSCNNRFSLSIEKLFQQEESKLKISLSNIILNYIENVAFKPSYIEDLFAKEKIETIKSGFMNNIFNPDVFTNVDVNLFVSCHTRNQ